MQWIAPSEKDTDNAALEKRLWEGTDQVCASCKLTHGSLAYDPR